tara:strand:+ start:51 stop:806 length:756 start_codon:yes stop_codon:yes gene_type:complete
MILKIKFFIAIIFISILFGFNIDAAINGILKDSLNFDLNSLSKNSLATGPDYIFLDALIEFNGDSAFKKYQDFYYSYPQHKHADYAVYEVGSYYYAKGYYVNSSSWFKKIPIYYHKSKLMEKSIEMFFNAMIISGFTDSLSYYSNAFSKLYPNLEISSHSINFPDELILNKESKDIKYTIQIGAFEEYKRAESRMYMLRSTGFSVNIVEQKKDGINFYLIREGEYSTKKSANKIAMRIKARTGLSPIIVEL